MKVKRSVLLAAASFTIALAGFVAPASAQPYRATIKLPTDARWGQAHLAAGEYTVTTQGLTSEGTLYVTGSGGTTLVRAMLIERIDPAVNPASKLEITTVDGVPVVTRLSLGYLGKVYNFAVPSALTKGSALAAPKVALRSGRK